MQTSDPFSQFKANQKVGWGTFAPMEIFTTPPAAQLVDFAAVKPGQAILDCACGTGVVAVTAARYGAKVKALDLAPALLERAKYNAQLAEVEIDFTEGDVEALPFKDASFDMVSSQFGHMFAPRPEVAIKEMLRVLKPGGTIAFSTWPPDHFIGSLFILVGKYLPPPPGVNPPAKWGEPSFVKEILGSATKELCFDRGSMAMSSLSPQHSRDLFEKASAPVTKIVNDFKSESDKLGQFRNELEKLIARFTKNNLMEQHYLMSKAIKV